MNIGLGRLEGPRVMLHRARALVPGMLHSEHPGWGSAGNLPNPVVIAVVDEQVPGRVHRHAQTLLMVTHDQHLATRCASRVVTLSDGKVADEASLERAS